MRIFIAGATGAMGRPLVERLVADGHEVTGLTRTTSGAALLGSLGATAVIGDALDGDALEKIMVAAAPSHVVHLLTSLPKDGVYRKSHYKATNEIRTRGTANLVRGALAAGAKRIVAESFPLVYGVRRDGDALLTESSPLQANPRGPSAEAVLALRSLESQVLAVRDRMDAIVLRYGYLYGESIDFTRVMFERLRDRKLPVMRGTNGIGSFLHIDDAIAATVASLDRGESGIYNVVDDQPAALSDFFGYAVKLIGAPKPMELPRWLLKMMAPVIVDLSSAQLPLSNAKAKRELGFAPRFRSYREGLRSAAAALGVLSSEATVASAFA